MMSRPSNIVSPYHKPSPSRTIYSDRFIPSRSSSNFSLFGLSPPQSDYATRIHTALFGPESLSVTQDNSVSRGNIFKFKSETRQPLHSLLDDHLHEVSQSPVKPLRTISTSPDKVLDAPGLVDDFYLNLLDWSPQNILAVGLGNRVYLKDLCGNTVTKLCDLGQNDSVCSVEWDPWGTNLAVGTSKGKVLIWDASLCERIRTMEGHQKRVGALAWSTSQLSSGSMDKSILQRDIRAQENYVSKLSGHNSEVCALKWSYNARELASGGNDNRLNVWNQHSIQPVLKYCEHTAAVKAIAWSPHLNGLLASGGGTADKCIRFWKTTSNSSLSCINTENQVCNLVWSKNVNELVSTHGYSQNKILVWRYPTLSKLATLEGHKARVLYLAISPDGKTIVTGAGDESLRFWNVFPSPRSQNTQMHEFGDSFSGRTQIR